MVERSRLSAIVLITDTSVLTSIGDDYGYEKLFSRHVHGEKEGVFIGSSTSGKWLNMLNAFEEARNCCMNSIGMMGNYAGLMQDLCDYLLDISSADTPKNQKGYLVLGYIQFSLVENAIFKARN